MANGHPVRVCCNFTNEQILHAYLRKFEIQIQLYRKHAYMYVCMMVCWKIRGTFAKCPELFYTLVSASYVCNNCIQSVCVRIFLLLLFIRLIYLYYASTYITRYICEIVIVIALLLCYNIRRKVYICVFVSMCA